MRPADPLARSASRLKRYVTENSHARVREPEGQIALTNAERQARYRARQSVPRPPVIIKQSRSPRRSRTKRWNDALAEMFAIQAE
jgi:hypothetical protein